MTSGQTGSDETDTSGAATSGSTTGGETTGGETTGSETTGDVKPPGPTDQKELFADDYIIESTENLTRVQNQAVKTEPIISPEHPWEGVGTNFSAAWGPGSVIKQGDTFKMWYLGMAGDVQTQVSVLGLYASSTDGVNWEKPNLGLVDYNGSKDNNRVPGPVLLTYDEDDMSGQPFKGYGGHPGGGYGGYGSKDGFSWEPLGFHMDHGDVSTMAFDPVKREYLINVKGNTKDANGFNYRKMYAVLSTDLYNYSHAKMSGLSDAEDAQGYVAAKSYGVAIFPYEGVYFGFHWLFLISDQIVGYGEDGLIEVDLLFKRGSYLDQWQRPSRDPIIPRGPEGAWDDSMITTASAPLVVDREIWLYYSGWDGDHVTNARTGQIAIAKWRLDGFLSMDAAEAEGTLVTKPMTFSGHHLLVNADASMAGGELQVELLDSAGDPIPGFTREECDVVDSDNVEHIISWGGNDDVSGLVGQEVRVKFSMKNTKLYALQFGEPRFD